MWMLRLWHQHLCSSSAAGQRLHTVPEANAKQQHLVLSGIGMGLLTLGAKEEKAAEGACRVKRCLGHPEFRSESLHPATLGHQSNLCGC